MANFEKKNYADLQKENAKFQGGFTQDEIDEELKKQGIPTKAQSVAKFLASRNNYEAYDIETPLRNQRTHLGDNDYFGRSMFDPDVLEGNVEIGDPGTVRAENQPWYSKIASGVGKFGVTAFTTAAELVGTAAGIGFGLANVADYDENDPNKKANSRWSAFLSGVWDNPITQALKAINDVSEDLMPNYYTRDEMENPMAARNIFSANFLADSLIKNFGFMVGAYYSGIPLAKGIASLGTKGAKGIKAYEMGKLAGAEAKAAKISDGYASDIIDRAGQLSYDMKGVEEGSEAAKKILQSASAKGTDGEVLELYNKLNKAGVTPAQRAEMFRKGSEKLHNAAGLTRYSTQLLGSIGSAINEGAIEAINNSKDWEISQKDIAKNEYNETLAKIDAEYGDSPVADAAKAEAFNDYQKKLTEIEKGRIRMGNADFLMNIPILTASNAYQLGRLYTKGFSGSKRLFYDNTTRDIGDFITGHKAKFNPKTKKYEAGRSKTLAVASALNKTNTEGMEEFLQRAASDGAGNAVTESINSNKSDEKFTDYLRSSMEAFASNIHNPHAQQEYVVGALSSLLGMPMFGGAAKKADIHLGPIGLSGGIVGNIKDYNSKMERDNQIVNYINERLKDPKFNTLYDYLKTHRRYDELLNDALLDDDKKKFKDISYEQLVKDINYFSAAGLLDEYKAKIGLMDEYTDEDLKQIVEANTQEVSAEDAQKSLDEAKANKAAIEATIQMLSSKTNKTEKEQEVLEKAKSTLKIVEKVIDSIPVDKEGNAKKYFVGPFIDKNGQSHADKEEVDADGKTIPNSKGSAMRAELKKNRDYLLDTINKYIQIRDNIDLETGGTLDDRDISVLTMLRGKIDDAEERMYSMSRPLKEVFLKAVSRYQKDNDVTDENIQAKEEEISKLETDEEDIVAQLESIDKKLKELDSTKDKKSNNTGTLKDKQKLEKAKKDLKKQKEDLNKKEKDIKATLDGSKKDLIKLQNQKAKNERKVKLLKDFGVTPETIETHDTSFMERLGYHKEAGDGLNKAFNFSEKRSTSIEELEGILQDTNNYDALKEILDEEGKNMSAYEKKKLDSYLVDMAILAQDKMDYNRHLRKFMKDPSLIEDAFKKIKENLNQQEVDNKINEIALSLTKAKNLSEIDSLYRGARGISIESADSSLDKAISDAKDSNQKEMLEAFKKFTALYNKFVEQIPTITSESVPDIQQGLFSSIEALKEGLLEDNPVDPYKEFIDLASNLWEGAQANDAIIDPLAASEMQKAINTIFDRLDAQKTNTSTVKPTGTKASAKKASASSSIKPKIPQKRDIVEEIEKKVEEVFKNAIDNDKEATIEDVLKAIDEDKTLSKSIETFNEKQNKEEDKINLNAVIFNKLNALDDSIAFNSDIDDSVDNSNIDPLDSVREREMEDEHRSHFISDYASEYEYLNSDNANTTQEAVFSRPLLGIIQYILKKYGAYDFLNHNFLGYLNSHYEGALPEIHLIKAGKLADEDVTIKVKDKNSINEKTYNVNEQLENAENSPVFMAIPYEEEKVHKALAKVFKDDIPTEILENALVTVYNKNGKTTPMILLGALSYNGKSDNVNAKDLREAFDTVQDAINNTKLDDNAVISEENSTYFIDSELLTDVSKIFTGRLHLPENLSADKVSLKEVVSETAEWKAGVVLAIGVQAGGSIHISSSDEYLITSDVKGKADIINDANAGEGSIYLYVPRPDGNYYPLRCTRRTVADWLSNGGSEVLDTLLDEYINDRRKFNKEGEGNDFIKAVIDALGDLLNPETKDNERLAAKSRLNKLFLIGNTVKFSFNTDGGNAYLTYYDLDGKVVSSVTFDSNTSIDNNIRGVFESFSNNGVKFSVPSPTLKDFGFYSSDIIEADILEIGISDFYNVNANFTVDVIKVDKEGKVDKVTNLQTVDTKVSKDNGIDNSNNNGSQKYEYTIKINNSDITFTVSIDTGGNIDSIEYTNKKGETKQAKKGDRYWKYVANMLQIDKLPSYAEDYLEKQKLSDAVKEAVGEQEAFKKVREVKYEGGDRIGVLYVKGNDNNHSEIINGEKSAEAKRKSIEEAVNKAINSVRNTAVDNSKAATTSPKKVSSDDSLPVNPTSSQKSSTDASDKTSKKYTEQEMKKYVGPTPLDKNEEDPLLDSLLKATKIVSIRKVYYKVLIKEEESLTDSKIRNLIEFLGKEENKKTLNKRDTIDAFKNIIGCVK